MSYRILQRFPSRTLLRVPGLLVLMLFGCQAWAQEPESEVSAQTNANAGGSIVELVEQMGPSVVSIHVTLENVRVFPGAGPSERQGGGSGFVVDEQGRIATNFHVVAAALQESALEQGALELRPDATLTVSFTNQPGEEFSARVVGANADYDLALLEVVDGQDHPQAKPVPLGDSNSVQPGQDAIAIGAPFGLQSTVTAGIISAVEREQPGLVGIEVPFIQSDVAINPGNSGGPLFNAQGEVIAISNAILASPMGPQAFVGVGFAVPINLLKENMDDLVAGGLSGVVAALSEMSERPRLGLTAPMSVADYPPELRQTMELPDHGVVVGEVTPGSPADEAGLRGATGAVFAGGQAYPVGGDVITGVEDEDVQRTIHLQQVVLSHEAGDEVSLDVWRDGEERTVDVELEVVPPQETRPASENRPQSSGERLEDFDQAHAGLAH